MKGAVRIVGPGVGFGLSVADFSAGAHLNCCVSKAHDRPCMLGVYSCRHLVLIV